MNYDITALGEILIDFTPCGNDPDGDSMMSRKAGGAPLNLLYTVSKYGGRTAFIGKVGEDIFGRFLLKTLRDGGIDASGVAVDPIHNTTLAFVELSENGERNFSFYRRFGADIFLEKTDIRPELIAGSSFFHFGSLSSVSEAGREVTRYALSLASQSGCVITYDPNYREKLWPSAEQAVSVMRHDLTYADIVKLSLDEARLITGKNTPEDCFAALSVYDLSLVLMTDGANGSRIFYDGENAFIPAFPVDSVDTTGAGDIYFGAFLSCLIRNGYPDVPLSFASACEFARKASFLAAQSTLKHGAIASVPDFC